MADFRTTDRADPVGYVCPATRVLDLIAHKWTVAIVRTLHRAGGPVRFRELQRSVGSITPKELTKRLRDLERAGLATRTIFAEVPPRVEYALTSLGLTLMPTLDALHQWAGEHADQVDANRRSFDEARDAVSPHPVDRSTDRP